MQTPPPPRLNIPRYYTHLSMILFILSFFIRRSFLKTSLLLNSIFVGIMGNMILINNIDAWISQGYTARDVIFSNFISHTLPMLLSFIILFSCPPEKGETSKHLLFLSALFLLWTAIPFNGMNMSTKVFDSYRVKVGVLIMFTVVLTVSTCKSIQYFSEEIH
jgi:hypothetical protein